MAILSILCKPDNSESHSFFWLWIYSWIKLWWYSCFMWDKIGRPNWFQFFWEELPSIKLKKRTYFLTVLIPREFEYSHLCFQLALLLFLLSVTISFLRSFWCYFVLYRWVSLNESVFQCICFWRLWHSS